VDVAVGVLIQADGRFLLAQRPLGKPMAGYWEFPGGKLEAGEDVRTALAREFLEELGIVIEAAVPWVIREFSYPHAHVRLHFWRIYAWQGEPQSLEGQALRWERLDNPCVEPWLPGALPLKRWLALPARYAISAAAELGVEGFLERLDEKGRRGQIQLLQLREKTLSPERFGQLFSEVWARSAAYGFRLLVNSAHPEEFWHRAHGVHLTHADLLACATRPLVQWCAASCHDEESLSQAARLGVDCAVLGPVCATASHPAARGLGWEGFAGLCAQTAVPLYAIGGLVEGDLNRARGAGAQGVALLRDSWR
jgi:8-oxo-dGTP diphosphatase